MKFFSILFLIPFVLPAMAYGTEFFERNHFKFNQGNISLRPGVNASNYNVGAKGDVDAKDIKPQWNTLNKKQVITHGKGQAPYHLEIHTSSTNPGDYMFLEGGASTAQQGRSESELIVTEVKNKRITARTRCTSKHSVVKESNIGIPSIEFNIGNFFSSHTSKNNRELMDCTTVTPKFCQDIGAEVTGKQMRSCISTMKKIASRNPQDWKELKAKESLLADNWTMPLAENFYKNVDAENKRGSKKSVDTTQLQKYTGFTDKDTNSFVNLVRDCEIFKFNKPITNAAASAVAPAPGVNQPRRGVETGL